MKDWEKDLLNDPINDVYGPAELADAPEEADEAEHTHQPSYAYTIVSAGLNCRATCACGTEIVATAKEGQPFYQVGPWLPKTHGETACPVCVFGEPTHHTCSTEQQQRHAVEVTSDRTC